MGNTKNRVYMTFIQITDVQKKEEMITLKRKHEEFKAVLEIFRSKGKKMILLHLVF